jgi:hypothetical protein
MTRGILAALVSCLAAALISAPAHAQKDDLLVYLSKPRPSQAVTNEDRTTYKSYVGVYVRAKVMRAFLQDFDDVTDVKWHYNQDFYVATFKKDGRICRALYTTKGCLINLTQTGTQKDLPREVYRLLKATYVDYAIGPVTELHATNGKAWIVNLEDKDNLIVTQVVNGQLEELHHFKTHF